MHHLLQLGARDGLFLLVGFFLDETGLLRHVRGVHQQHALSRQAVAAGAAGFLIIAFDVFREVAMDHEPDVRLVDAHAERDGGANHLHVVVDKRLLIARAFFGVHARVIRRGFYAVFQKPFGQLLSALATATIYDAAFALVFFDDRQYLLDRLLPLDYAVIEVGPVEAGDEARRVF